MNQYIDLDRKYLTYSHSFLGEQDDISYQYLSFEAKITWEDILKYKCSIIIAEGGSGKTAELKNMANKLTKQNKHAFFIDISLLAAMDFDHIITTSGYKKDFDVWQQGHDPAYFLLDSVDEAKLKSTKDFEIALKKFVAVLHSHLHRVHIVISSRPASWQANADQRLILELLNPFLQEREGKLSQKVNGQHSFIEREQRIEIKHNEILDKDIVQIFLLAPLTLEQKEKYAQALGVEDVSNFMRELVNVGIEAFTARPQDLEAQINYWKDYKSFGQYSKLIERDINIKLNEINENHSHHSPLAPNKIKEGVKALAAAVTFLKKGTILLPDIYSHNALKDSALDPQKVLIVDWTKNEILTLLNLPIFDEALNGTVRFHHRTIREYLTAEWIFDLLKKGKNKRAIENLLFIEKYGIKLIIPSMRPIAAWLAGKDSKIYRKVVAINPEVLLEHGDPTLLDVKTRAQLLLNFASHYSKRNYTGLRLNLREVKRVAHQELNDTIITLLEKYKNHMDIRKILLKIIWQGSIIGCEEILFKYALNNEMDLYTRIYAIRAIGESGTEKEKAKLAKQVFINLKEWDHNLLAAAIGVLFPQFIKSNDLLIILEHIGNIKLRSYDALEYQLDILPTLISPEECLYLLQYIVKLILKYIDKFDKEKFYKQYGFIISLAIKLTERIIANNGDKFDHVILYIVSFIKQDHDLEAGYSNVKRINQLVSNNKKLKQELFWYEANQRRQYIEKNWSDILYLISNNNISEDDTEYFLNKLNKSILSYEKFVALDVLFYICIQKNFEGGVFERVKEEIKGEPQLEEALQMHLDNFEANQIKLKERQYSKKDVFDHENEKQNNRLVRIQSFKKNPKIIQNNIGWLYTELASLVEDRNHLTISQWELLEPEFGYEVAVAFRDYCIKFWRTYLPELRSQSTEPNSIPFAVSLGLSGIAMEAKINPDWVSRLTPNEAEIAMRYALYELNNFPEWVEPLWKNHSKHIKLILILEIKSEIICHDDKQPISYLFERLRGSGRNLGLALQKDLISIIQTLSNLTNSNLLAMILEIILQDVKSLSKSFLTFIKDSYKRATIELIKALWLSAWFCLENTSAVNELRIWLATSHDNKISEKRICAIFGYLFSNNSFRINNSSMVNISHDTLLSLIVLTYTYVHPNDDSEHVGVYSPDARDNAERVRSLLIETLFNIPGYKTYQSLHKLSEVFQSMNLHFLKDRMLVLADQRAGEDSEFSPWKPEDISNFAAEAELYPKSENDLFIIAKSRIDDLKHDIEEGDESNANLFQKCKDEVDLRKLLSNSLQKISREKYIIASEEELADRTRTDFRFHYPKHNIRPVVTELKIADRYTLTELSERLQNQLVGQYMRNSTHGIFLLVKQNMKRWQMPMSRNRIDFVELIEYLKTEAQIILKNNTYIDSLEIIGIDLTKRGC